MTYLPWPAYFGQPISCAVHLALHKVNRRMGPLSQVLLVDDNYIQSATRRAILENAGNKVVVASHGQHALEYLQEPGPAAQFGLIITDHLMPVMNGPAFVTELRRRGFKISVIVLSGLPEAEAEYGELDVIFKLKPLDPATLILLVQELMGDCMRRSA